MSETSRHASTQETSSSLLLSAMGLLCFVSAATTLYFTTSGGSLATLWPANAMILTLMLRQPRREWPRILLVGFAAIWIANVVVRGQFASSTGFGLSNLPELLIAGFGLRPTDSGRRIIGASGSAWPFLVTCGLIGPAVSGIGAATTALYVYGIPFQHAFGAWFLSHSLGLLLFTPAYVSLVRGDYGRALHGSSGKQLLQAFALLAFTAVVTTLVFAYARLPVLFITFVPVMIISFRVGRVGTELAVLIVAIVGAVCTLKELGPIAALVHGAANQIHFLQLYLATLLLTSIPVSAELNARRRLTAKLAQSEKTVKMLAAKSADVLIAIDAKGVCRNAAGATERLLSAGADGLIGKPASALATPECADQIAIAMTAARNDPGMTAICEFRSATTDHLWLEASITSANDEDGDAGLVATIRDVTERKEREATLSQLVRTDGLTGALNRSGFLETLDEFAAHDTDRPYALAAIDIDHFKGINDTLGHHAGDAALQQLSRLLASGVRRVDAVGRIGGDEFMVALRATDIATAAAICGRLTETVHNTIFTLPGGGSMRLSISCGIAQHQLGATSESTRQAADEALYEAKRAGRNRISIAA